MTPAQHEKARLRSERWRRAHGIKPRRPPQRPWLAEGISRSTWYRRHKQAHERGAVAICVGIDFGAISNKTRLPDHAARSIV